MSSRANRGRYGIAANHSQEGMMHPFAVIGLIIQTSVQQHLAGLQRLERELERWENEEVQLCQQCLDGKVWTNWVIMNAHTIPTMYAHERHDREALRLVWADSPGATRRVMSILLSMA